MKEKTAEKLKEGVKALSSMRAKQSELKDRLGTMYSDRLTGVLSVDDYVRMSDKIKKEMYCIEDKILQ